MRACVSVVERSIGRYNFVGKQSERGCMHASACVICSNEDECVESIEANDNLQLHAGERGRECIYKNRRQTTLSWNNS